MLDAPGRSGEELWDPYSKLSQPDITVILIWGKRETLITSVRSGLLVEPADSGIISLDIMSHDPGTVT